VPPKVISQLSRKNLSVLYRTDSLFAYFILLAEAAGQPDLAGVKRNGVTGLLPEVTWSEDFRERVVIMPSISSDFAARLAADLSARGARLFYGHSDFGFPPGHIEIDTRQLDGLRTFYRKVAAEKAKIDLCIHCLAKQPVTDLCVPWNRAINVYGLKPELCLQVGRTSYESG
jgi:hypothetical protein